MAKVSLLWVALLTSSVASLAGDVPRPAGHINDQARILSPRVAADLERTLTEYEAETTHQIAVLTVASLGGEPLEAFSLRVANEWKMGRKHYDNGVLVVLAIQERAVRIELGVGMNRYVSNQQAEQVIDAMRTYFREARFDEGVRIGLDRLMKLCRAYQVKAE